MLKKRKAKKSERGIYIQDIQLKDSVFKPGSHFKYLIDNKKKEVIILPDEESKNTVSKRSIKNGVKPVIDIRNAEALKAFKDMDFLEIEIFEEKILVKGLKEEPVEEANTLVSKIKKTAKKAVRKISNVVNITEKIELKKQFEVLMSRKQLDKVVGQSFEQITLFDLLNEDNVATHNDASSAIKKAIFNAKIPLQIASLYSGAGIMDLGFKQAGFELKFGLELNEEAAETYRYNLGDHINVADIQKFDLNNIYKASVMIIGNPCTVFTNTNRSKKRLLNHPDYVLVKRTIEAIKANQSCAIFVWENVPQILTALDGQVLEEIIEELNEFEISYGVLNAADFGAAQLRKRAFIIGSKIGKVELPKPYFEPKDYRTVEEAFLDLDDTVPNQMDFTKPKAETLEKMKYVRPGNNWRDIPDHLKNKKMAAGSTHSSIFRRLEWDKPSVSLPNVRKCNIMPPEGLRSLSVRETARLFGVPDDFIFKGKLSSMQQQICNAVCVPMARAIGMVVKKTIQQFNIRNGFEKLGLV